MELFSVVEDAFVILRSKGLERQAKVYERGPRIYAAYGSGFLCLLRGGITTMPDVRWIDASPEVLDRINARVLAGAAK